MNDEAALPGRPDTAQLSGSEVSTVPGQEPSVEEIVLHCRAVAAAAGMSWIHDLVVEELGRLSRRLAA